MTCLHSSIFCCLTVFAAQAFAPQTVQAAGDKDVVLDGTPSGCHIRVKADVDDQELFSAVTESIEAHPVRQAVHRGEYGPCINILQINKGYVTLVAQHLPNEMIHWLAHDPLKLQVALEQDRPLGHLFASSKTAQAERRLASLLPDLTRALAKNPDVKGVYWAELEEQKEFCPLCTPGADIPRPAYEFYFPPVNASEFLSLVSSLHIRIAMPTQDETMLQPHPSHIWEKRILIDRGVQKTQWQLRFLGLPGQIERSEAKHLLHLSPNGRGPKGARSEGYLQSRQILDWAGLWNHVDLQQSIYHIFPPELDKELRKLWFDQYTHDMKRWPNLNGKTPSLASFAFRKDANGQWSVYVWKLSYR